MNSTHLSRDGSTQPVAARTLELFVATIEDYAIFMLDPDGNVLSWNRGAEKIKGYRAEEIIGRHFSIFYGTEDLAAHKP
ncbi:MAG TPA: PAS domain S-box protein, partial [Pararobbsia sp.]|nr:PAS domain S-box protein [Pararobbsia sp.]